MSPWPLNHHHTLVTKNGKISNKRYSEWIFVLSTGVLRFMFYALIWSSTPFQTLRIIEQYFNKFYNPCADWLTVSFNSIGINHNSAALGLWLRHKTRPLVVRQILLAMTFKIENKQASSFMSKKQSVCSRKLYFRSKIEASNICLCKLKGTSQ